MLIIEQYFLSLVFCSLKTELWWESLEISEQTIGKGRRRKNPKQTNKNSFPPEHIACNPHPIVEIPSWAQVNIQLRIHHYGELWKMKTHFLLHLKTSSKLGIVVKKKKCFSSFFIWEVVEKDDKWIPSATDSKIWLLLPFRLHRYMDVPC